MESCKKRSRVISKAKQQDLDVELGRVMRKGSKQPSVRSAREQLEEASNVTRPDTSKIYEKNFQQSKPEEPTSTLALPVKVVARSVDEIIASLQSPSPSLSDQTIKELLESVLGQNYNIKMEVGEPEQEQYFFSWQAPIEHEEIKTESQVLPSFHEKTAVVHKESQAAENESQPKDEQLTYDRQVKQAPPLNTLQVEGKAVSKIKPDGVQKELQEEHTCNNLCLLTLQVSKVNIIQAFIVYVLLFLVLCCLLIYRVSRVCHTLDRRGHNTLFTAEDMDNKEEEPIYSKYIYLKEQAERKSNVIEDVIFEDFFTDHEEELEAEQDDHDFYDYGLTKRLLRRCQSLPDSESSETSLIKISVSALKMTAFKDETMLNMSANFKTSMKELKVMKQRIAEPEAESEIEKSSPTKTLLNQICDDSQLMQTYIPVEKNAYFN